MLSRLARCKGGAVEGSKMLDALVVAVTVAFFALTWAYMRGLERL